MKAYLSVKSLLFRVLFFAALITIGWKMGVIHGYFVIGFMAAVGFSSLFLFVYSKKTRNS